MKRYLKPAYLPVAMVGAGLLAFLFRLWLFAIGKDDRGLLSVGNFPDAMSWIVTALAMVLIFLVTRNLRGGNKYSYNFPASLPAAIGMVSAFLGFLATAAMLMLARCRVQGKHLSIVFHGIVCFYLMIFLVSHYRLWSSAPQLQSYAFELLAIVFVMLACYQRCAFDAGKGSRLANTFFSKAELFFCIATLPGCDNVAFFLGCAAWMYCTPCRLALPAKKEN